MSYLEVLQQHLSEVLKLPTNVTTLHTQLTSLMIVCGALAFISLFFTTAPYGRYARGGWGPLLDNRFAWFTQECPSFFVTAYICYTAGVDTFINNPTSVRTVTTALFLSHYTYRSLIYPFKLKRKNCYPLSVWLLSLIYCIWNGFLQGYALGYLIKPDTPINTLAAVGIVFHIIGLLNLIRCDGILINLRKPGETGYKIPYGSFFGLCSAGNYTAEIMEWTAYAMTAQTLASATFAFFAFCNLAPRAVDHHKWYKQKFDNYPRNRKAVIPFIW